MALNLGAKRLGQDGPHDRFDPAKFPPPQYRMVDCSGFRDYAFDRRTFGVAEVRAQMQAARDAGAMGFMLWNPTNRYTADSLGRRTP